VFEFFDDFEEGFWTNKYNLIENSDESICFTSSQKTLKY